MATGVTLPRRLALGRVKRQPTQKRDPDVTVDGRVLLLYVFAILTSKFKQDLGWCLDDDVNQKYAFLDTKCETNSCGVEGPPCQAPAESDDDDCVDDEDWSYVTKEGVEYDCDHVAKKTKRCTTRFSEDGVRADDACKKTCGTC